VSVFLSHADLDHFNGLVALLDRFAVGQVTCTPTFADKSTEGVHQTLEELQRRRVPVRIAKEKDHFTAGALSLEVLHPPERFRKGNENARSLVLLIRHERQTILLTGDLEGEGLDRVLALPPPRIDVLMAPHHGSRIANRPELVPWARPRLVIASQGPPHRPNRTPDVYTASGIAYLGTWPHGAVTMHSRHDGLVVETFLTGQRLVLRPGKEP
jgi:competence protein ComEC